MPANKKCNLSLNKFDKLVSFIVKQLAQCPLEIFTGTDTRTKNENWTIYLKSKNGETIQFLMRQLQGFGAGAARSWGIWLEPELSLWPGSGSGSSLNFSLIIHANCMVHNLF